MYARLPQKLIKLILGVRSTTPICRRNSRCLTSNVQEAVHVGRPSEHPATQGQMYMYKASRPRKL